MLGLPLCPCREAPKKTKRKRQEEIMDVKCKREIQLNIRGAKKYPGRDVHLKHPFSMARASVPNCATSSPTMASNPSQGT